jgi:hypothetical protein
MASVPAQVPHVVKAAGSSREARETGSVGPLSQFKRWGEQCPEHEQVLLNEVRRHYQGEVVTGHDLDVF